MPPSPSFYSNPESISDLVDSVIARVLDHLKIEHDLVKEWGQPFMESWDDGVRQRAFLFAVIHLYRMKNDGLTVFWQEKKNWDFKFAIIDLQL